MNEIATLRETIKRTQDAINRMAKARDRLESEMRGEYSKAQTVSWAELTISRTELSSIMIGFSESMFRYLISNLDTELLKHIDQYLQANKDE